MNQDDDPTRLVGRPVPPPIPGDDPGDQPTRIIRNPEPLQIDEDTSEPTRIYGHGDDEPTTLVGHDAAAPAPVEEDQKTILYRPNRAKPSGDTGEAADTGATGTDSAAEEPVVGWVVVIKGNGAGHSHQLSYGINSIGRDSSQRVSLDYGDPTVSRENHVSIAYDPKGRNFFIQQGGSTSLGYLDGAPILQPTKLTGGEKIDLGDTTLSFVPFCNSDFDWEEAE